LALGIIEINDAGIQVAIENEIVTISPGFAVMDGDHLLVGEEALQKCPIVTTLDQQPILESAQHRSNCQQY